VTLNDLGVTLEEDSPDVTEVEVAEAAHTENMRDFIQQVNTFLGGVNTFSTSPRMELRRKGGVLFSRVSVGTQRRLFQVEWLRGNS